MRRLLLLVLLVGCPEHGKRPDGGVRDVATFDPPFADAGALCSPSGGCPSGPACGAACCNIGEQCVAGVCHCGMDFACTLAGDTCQTGGPGGGSVCGTVCCGSAQHPCPL
jgi:hypothetical protein